MRTCKLLIFAMLGTLAARSPAADSSVPGDFGWLAGQWCMESGGQFVEEHWLPARDDLMLGLSRTVKGGKTVSFEFLRIERNSEGATLLAQPQGAPPTAFRMSASGPDWVRFENPKHDFPKRVEYRRTPEGLHAEVAGPGKGGKELVIPFEYRACD